MEDSEVAITHPLLKKELLGEGGRRSGNTHVDMDNQLKWMVFKVKQRAASNYFKKTVLRNPIINSTVESSDVTQDEFGSTSKIQYNWPYDFFSLVELIKIDAEVEFGNFNQSQLENYVDSIPSYVASTTDDELLEDKISGMENGAVSDGLVPQGASDAGLSAFAAAASTPAGLSAQGSLASIPVGTTMSLSTNPFINPAMNRSSAVAFMNNLRIASGGSLGEIGGSGSGTRGAGSTSKPSKQMARRMAIQRSVPDHRDFLLDYNFINSQGNVIADTTQRLEMMVASDYALTIPVEFSELSDL